MNNLSEVEMNKPRVGVTLNYKPGERGNEIASLDSRYLDYLVGAGAVPVPIMPTLDTDVVGGLLDVVGGVLFTGGLDLDPAMWGEERHPETVSLHPRRHESEFFLYREVRKRRLAILGICLGSQVINVAEGGTLYQHLPDVDSVVVHQMAGGQARHRLTLAAGSKLSEWMGGQAIEVNSYHHQGINRVGGRLEASAHAENGLVEAIEDRDYPFLVGVQWHPERNMDEPINATLVRRFIEACG